MEIDPPQQSGVRHSFRKNPQRNKGRRRPKGSPTTGKKKRARTRKGRVEPLTEEKSRGCLGRRKRRRN
jgi:hypothetical protein